MAVLAQRMQAALSAVIGEEQTGFLKQRSIFNPILVLKTLMAKHKARKHGMALLLDFERAYDRVDQKYLIACLETLGFPASWTQLLSSIQCQATSNVLVNNQITCQHQ
jgi:hypothetical protein